MDWRDEMRKKLADAGVEMFQKSPSSLDTSQSLKNVLEKLNQLTVRESPSLEQFESMKNELEKLKEQVKLLIQPKSLDSAKEFTVKHSFADVSKIGDGGWKCSPIEYHFGVPWCIRIYQENDHLGVYLFCERNKANAPWSIECAFQLEVFHPSGKTESRQLEYIYQKEIGHGWGKFLKWEEMKKEYLVQDQLTVVAHATIKSMIGFQ